MRKVTYGGAVSLDGFLAGMDGSMDWLHFSKDVQEIMTNYWKGLDTILMGRKTYAFAAAQAASTGENPKKQTRRREQAIRTYIFSHTLKAIDQPGVHLVAGDAIQFVRNLKRGPGGGICLMGGGELAQSLLAADLVDEIGLNIHPILLGAGIPAFRDPGQRVKLKLTHSRTLEGG